MKQVKFTVTQGEKTQWDMEGFSGPECLGWEAKLEELMAQKGVVVGSDKEVRMKPAFTGVGAKQNQTVGNR